MATSTSRSSGTKKTTKRASPTKKSSAEKSTSKETAAKKSSSSADSDGGSEKRRSAPKARPRPPARATQVAAQAARELLELTGKQAEGVTGLEKTDDGWTVQVEVVEVRRIPDTTDVLALYEIQADGHGALLGYRRVRRYTRGVPGDD
jgi:hypothetical protein